MLLSNSYQPDECYSPVVSKDTLRLLLSVAAAKNPRLYTADVTAAFLQAPLEERIYMRCPDGYVSTTANGEEEVLELRNAIYGLHQSSAAFWTVLHQHLVNEGFKSVLGDPCLGLFTVRLMWTTSCMPLPPRLLLLRS